MKRKIVMVLSACMVFAAAQGCASRPQDAGAGTETPQEGGAEMREGPEVYSVDIEYDPEDYVTLGDYMGVEVSLNEAEYQVADEDVEDYADQMLLYSNPYVADESRTVVEADSIVEADYVGKKDGEPFDGGSAEKQIIDVANNSSPITGTGYIAGFTDGLVGAKVGETVDCEVTFPDDYQSEELKGQKVVFTFTVHSVGSLLTRESLTDEYVQEKFQLENVDAFIAETRGYLEEQAKAARESALREKVIQKVSDTCGVSSLPEGLLDARIDEYISLYKKRNCPEGTDFGEYLQTNYNMTEDEFYEQNKTNIETSITQELIFEAIAKKEGLAFEQDEYDQYIASIVSNGGFESADALYENYGEDKDYGRKYFEKVYLVNKSCNYVMENAKVTQELSSGEGAETGTDTEAVAE